MFSKMFKDLSNTPRQLAIISQKSETDINKSKLLRFVKSRNKFYEKLSNKHVVNK